MPPVMSLHRRPLDAFLLFWFCLFAVSSLVYFGYEFLDEANRSEANLLAVFLVNVPYTIIPLLLMWRMRRPDPFGATGRPSGSES